MNNIKLREKSASGGGTRIELWDTYWTLDIYIYIYSEISNETRYWGARSLLSLANEGGGVSYRSTD